MTTNLTIDAIRQMSAGREMDALVASRVMGWREVRLVESGFIGFPPGHLEVDVLEAERFPVPDYSTDISAAWLVVERMGLFSLWNHGDGEHCCEFGRHRAYAETAMLAICRAVLIARVSR